MRGRRGRHWCLRPTRGEAIGVLAYANLVRDVLGHPRISALRLRDTTPDDEAADVVGTALGVPTGMSERPIWARRGQWVMRLADPADTRRVGVATGRPWSTTPLEVALPDAVVDLAVSHHRGVVVADARGMVLGWWLPGEDGLPTFLTPTDPIIDGVR